MIDVFVVAIVRMERNEDLGYVRAVRDETKKHRGGVNAYCLKLWYTDDCEELLRTRFEYGGLVMEARRMLRDGEFIIPDLMESEIVPIFRILEK